MTTPEKGKDTRFQKGKSGNPGGRPKDAAKIRDLALKHCPEAIMLLVRMMKSKSKRVTDENRRLAALAVLDRGIGKPVQPVDIPPDGGFASLWAQALKESKKDPAK